MGADRLAALLGRFVGHRGLSENNVGSFQQTFTRPARLVRRRQTRQSRSRTVADLLTVVVGCLSVPAEFFARGGPVPCDRTTAGPARLLPCVRGQRATTTRQKGGRRLVERIDFSEAGAAGFHRTATRLDRLWHIRQS